MLGPTLVGRNGVSLVPPTLEHFKLRTSWVVAPEVGRFWGPRFGELTDERQEKRLKDTAESGTEIEWTIAYQGEPVGFTGIFGIDWVRRAGESGIIIGRHDLYGRGIASDHRVGHGPTFTFEWIASRRHPPCARASRIVNFSDELGPPCGIATTTSCTDG